MQSTTSMTSIRRGDVVIYRAQYSDLSGSKIRPAVVVSSPDFHRGRSQVVVANLTTNVSTGLAGKYLLLDWAASGLRGASATSGDIATVDRSKIGRRIGSVSSRDMTGIMDALKQIFGMAD